MSTTYEGRKCTACGSKKRYRKTRECVACAKPKAAVMTAYQIAKQQQAKSGESTAPPPLIRPKGWPTVETLAGDIVAKDPIAVMMEAANA